MHITREQAGAVIGQQGQMINWIRRQTGATVKVGDPNPANGTRSVAFAPEFNSFGHCAQGGLVLLMFPAVETRLGACGAWRRRPAHRRWRRLLVRLASCAVVVYPVCSRSSSSPSTSAP